MSYKSCDGAWTPAWQRKSTVCLRKHIAFKLRPRLRLCHQYLNNECPSEIDRSPGLRHHVDRCEARKIPAPSYSHSQHPASRLSTDLDESRRQKQHLFASITYILCSQMTMTLLFATHSALTARKPSETLRHATTTFFLRRYALGGGLEVLNLGPELFGSPSPSVKVFGKSMC